MTRLTGPTVLFLVTLCVSSAEDNVEVFYQREDITPARGSSVKLSCEARYDFVKCGLLHVVWQTQGAELTNPRKYLTTVNETILEDNFRRRQVVTEILDLKPQDNNEYQCKADCESGDTAMGHIVSITVEG